MNRRSACGPGAACLGLLVYSEFSRQRSREADLYTVGRPDLTDSSTRVHARKKAALLVYL
jgi:hypothetical protein